MIWHLKCWSRDMNLRGKDITREEEIKPKNFIYIWYQVHFVIHVLITYLYICLLWRHYLSPLIHFHRCCYILYIVTLSISSKLFVWHHSVLQQKFTVSSNWKILMNFWKILHSFIQFMPYATFKYFLFIR